MLPANSQVGHCLDVVRVVDLTHFRVSIVIEHGEETRGFGLTICVDIAVCDAFEVTLNLDAVLTAGLDCVVKRNIVRPGVLQDEFSMRNMRFISRLTCTLKQ